MAKTGGRKAGTPNKRTREVMDRLEELNCDPIEGMVRIAQQAMSENNLHLAGQMYKELAQYVAPKRKAIEMSTDVRDLTVEEMTDAQLDALIASHLS